MEMNPRPFHMSSGLMASSASFLAAAAAAAAPSSTTTLREYMPALSSSTSSSSSPAAASLGLVHYIHSAAPQPAAPPAFLQGEASSLSYVTAEDYAEAGFPLTKPFLPSKFPAEPPGGADGRSPMAAAADKLYVVQQEGSRSHLNPYNQQQQRSLLQTLTPALRDHPAEASDPGCRGTAEGGGGSCEPLQQVRHSCAASPPVLLQLKSSCGHVHVDAAMTMGGVSAAAAASSSDLGLMLGHAPPNFIHPHSALKHQRKREPDLIFDHHHAAADSQRFGIIGGGTCAALGGFEAVGGLAPPPPPPEGGGAAGIDSILCRTRAKRGCATHPRSIAERVRRTKISERMKKLQDLVPNLDKQAHTADMLDEVVEYVKQLQQQVQVLSQTTSKCKGMCQNRGRISDNKDGNERTK